MKKEFVLVGAGGHSQVIREGLELDGHQVVAYISEMSSGDIGGVPIIMGIHRVSEFAKCQVLLAVGSVGSTQVRTRIFNELENLKVQWGQFIHPSVYLSPSSKLGRGVQIHAGALIQESVRIDDNVIVNTGVIVDHSSHIGRDSHLATGVRICGSVEIGERVHVGAGSTIIQKVKVVDGVIIGAGSVVTQSIEIPGTYVGAPARLVHRK